MVANSTIQHFNNWYFLIQQINLSNILILLYIIIYNNINLYFTIFVEFKNSQLLKCGNVVSELLIQNSFPTAEAANDLAVVTQIDITLQTF